MSNFLDVPLTNMELFEELDGTASLGSKCLYSVSGLRQGYLGRFCNNYSRHCSDFLSAVEIPVSETREMTDTPKSLIEAGNLTKILIWSLVRTPTHISWSLDVPGHCRFNRTSLALYKYC